MIRIPTHLAGLVRETDNEHWAWDNKSTATPLKAGTKVRIAGVQRPILSHVWHGVYGEVGRMPKGVRCRLWPWCVNPVHAGLGAAQVVAVTAAKRIESTDHLPAVALGALSAAAVVCNVPEMDIIKPGRFAHMIRARHLFMAILSEAGYTNLAIARMTGRDQQTVSLHVRAGKAEFGGRVAAIAATLIPKEGAPPTAPAAMVEIYIHGAIARPDHREAIRAYAIGYLIENRVQRGLAQTYGLSLLAANPVVAGALLDILPAPASARMGWHLESKRGDTR